MDEITVEMNATLRIRIPAGSLRNPVRQAPGIARQAVRNQGVWAGKVTLDVVGLDAASVTLSEDDIAGARVVEEE